MQQFRRQEFSAVTFPTFCLIAMMLAYLPAGARQSPPKQASTQAPQQQPQGKAFASPEEAAAALYSATHDNDEAQLLVILGPNAKELITWSDNPRERQADRSVFAQKYSQMHRLVQEPDGTVALYIGAENWPLPIPLVEMNNQWYFDSETGKKEILFRRVGQNEIEALQVCLALVDAEKEYYDEAHAYTSQFVSREGSHDGLYWADTDSGEKSPIGPFLAHAGYGESEDKDRVPFHGYYYRILTVQGAGAPGGAKNYVANGKMTGGFAILAFPAEYRSSGVMTFVMDQDGVAYEKDLGPMTDKLSEQMTTYNPDSTWKKAQ